MLSRCSWPRRAAWRRCAPASGRSRRGIELAGKTLGIVGLGAIGAEIARIAAAFGMRVIAWNRSPIEIALPCAALPLDAVLAGADALCPARRHG
ncbi:MAG TPA: NAD(P)-dependent oxidoreductase [Stellaceae bacterium]|nr:NAD(P)-dependent oxidoreductase [Stellaceae bacterium]